MMPDRGDAPPTASSQCSPEQAIDHFLKRLTGSCRLLVAFSGGGDSTGLLAALSAACGSRPDISLHSVTVDHDLRAGSAEEARAAGRVSQELGVPHSIARWTGEKPETGIQAAAREARYRLLAAEAVRFGADVIVTGHNLDDQAETLFMRRQRNPDHAEGMDEAVLVERRTWVVRPFLKVRRVAIRDYLRHRSLRWIDDPSNDNPAFERVRVRNSEAQPDDILSVESRSNVFGAAAAFVRECVTVVPGPVAVVDLGGYTSDNPAHWTAIATLAATIGGRVHGPDSRAASTVTGRLADGGDFRASVNRVLFHRRGPMLYLYREERGLPEASYLPGQTGVWDGRYEIVNRGLDPVLIGAGRSLATACRLLPAASDDALPNEVARRIEASTPRLLDGDRVAISVRMMLAPFERFLPARKLDLANSLAKAFELEQFPSLPLSNGAF